MTYDEARQAFHAARRSIDAANSMTDDMAALIAGRLQTGKVGSLTLNKLKKELRRWDMHRMCWKD